jgi:hypothetical protein
MSNPNLVMEKIKWALLLVFSLIFLFWISFGTQSSGVSVSTNSSAAEDQVQEPVEESQLQSQVNVPAAGAEVEQDEAPVEQNLESIEEYQVFLDIDGEWGEPEISENTGIKDYLFLHTDSSELRISISLDKLNNISADYSWEHTAAEVEDGYNIDFVVDSGSNTVLCEEGSSGCSAGNGILDITSVNQASASEDAQVFVRVVVKDTEQDISEAENYYKNIIESIQVKKGQT